MHARSLVATSVFVALTVVLTAAPALAEPTRADVEHLLAGYEPHGSAAAFARLGEGTDRVLVAIALDRRTSDLRRIRALAALLFVPTDLGRDTCRQVIRDQGGADGGAASLEVAACAGTLGAFGPEVRGELLPLLGHPVAEVRSAAAYALGSGRLPEAATLLRRRLAVEGDEAVRRAIDESLRKLARK